ncbi:MAG TPA: DUF983 domain-containing protein [Kiloniellaceae bacterium]|nr:DUF983 domain-containing protein [Kiloniellaceae bacterium]
MTDPGSGREEPAGTSSSAVMKGLRCRCPRCGIGPLFGSYLTVADRCSHCGLDLSKQDSGDGPAIFVIFILGIVIVPAMLLVEVKLEPPIWVHFAVWPVAVIGGALALLPPMKGLMIAMQYKTEASEGGRVDYD